MSQPRLEACFFPQPGGDGRWARMAAVLEHTARRHNPSWRVRVHRLARAGRLQNASGSWSHEGNSLKLDHWNSVVQTADEGDEILLVDADTMVINPLDAIWAEPFDLAYTARPCDCRYPFNGGVVAVRANDATRAFFRRWALENGSMLSNRAHHQPWRHKFGGINQASFGYLLETPDAISTLQISAVPCQVWNCEDTCWPTFDPNLSRIVHIKSELRQACLYGRAPFNPSFRPIINLWREVDRELSKVSA